MIHITSSRQSVFETTLSQVEEHIKNGIWRPGDRLPTLQNLAQEFNVGVSTLREVLRILESRNIITIEQGRGMFVRTDLASTNVIPQELTPTSLKELFETRRVIEPELAYMAAQRGFMEEIEDIRIAALRMSNLVEHHQNFAEEDIKFHLFIAKSSHNNMLFEIFKNIENQFRKGRRYTNMIPGMIEKAVHYHLMIAESLSQRNAEQAKSLMKSHVEDMMSYVFSVMEQTPAAAEASKGADQ